MAVSSLFKISGRLFIILVAKSSDNGSWENICQILDHKTGKITLILSGKDYTEVPETVEKSKTFVGAAHIETDRDSWQKKTSMQTGNDEYAMAFFRYFSKDLQNGYFKMHPYEVVPGG